MTVHGGPHDRAPITKLFAVSGINPGSMVGAVLDGRYRVTERIARGGMATVYRGTDLRLDRPIAVKMLDLGLFAASDLAGKLADAIAADLQREAKTIARLSHPNVVAVFDHGVHAGHPYLVMEYVPGRTLRGLLTERPVLDPFEPVLAALAAAHRAAVTRSAPASATRSASTTRRWRGTRAPTRAGLPDPAPATPAVNRHARAFRRPGVPAGHDAVCWRCRPGSSAAASAAASGSAASAGTSGSAAPAGSDGLAGRSAPASSCTGWIGVSVA